MYTFDLSYKLLNTICVVNYTNEDHNTEKAMKILQNTIDEYETIKRNNKKPVKEEEMDKEIILQSNMTIKEEPIEHTKTCHPNQTKPSYH